MGKPKKINDQEGLEQIISALVNSGISDCKTYKFHNGFKSKKWSPKEIVHYAALVYLSRNSDSNWFELKQIQDLVSGKTFVVRQKKTHYDHAQGSLSQLIKHGYVLKNETTTLENSRVRRKYLYHPVLIPQSILNL